MICSKPPDIVETSVQSSTFATPQDCPALRFTSSTEASSDVEDALLAAAWDGDVDAPRCVLCSHVGVLSELMMWIVKQDVRSKS